MALAAPALRQVAAAFSHLLAGAEHELPLATPWGIVAGVLVRRRRPVGRLSSSPLGGWGPWPLVRSSSVDGVVGRPWSWVVNHWSSVFGRPSSVVGRRSWVAGSKPSKGRTVCACQNATITDPMPWRIPTEAGIFDATVHFMSVHDGGVLA